SGFLRASPVDHQEHLRLPLKFKRLLARNTINDCHNGFDSVGSRLGHHDLSVTPAKSNKQIVESLPFIQEPPNRTKQWRWIATSVVQSACVRNGKLRSEPCRLWRGDLWIKTVGN